MKLNLKHIEVLDDEMVCVLRHKTGAQRLQIASGMFTSARQMIISMLHSQHPDWDEQKINQETVRRLSHGAIPTEQTNK